MARIKILVVDDEARMRKIVRDFLVHKDFDVIEAENGEQAVDIFFKNKNIALIILDVMMPKMDGWQVVRTIRGYSQVPIIMLTAKGEERDELQGFQLGVDEYISKPFSPKILVARVEAILRRTNQAQEDLISAGGIVLDKAAHIVKIDEKPIELSYKEFELLKYLVQHPGRVFTRAQLLQEVWGYDYYGGTRTVDVHVRRLRAKLGGEYEHLIGTVRNVGYRFDPPEEESANNTAREAAEMGSSTPAEE